MNHSGVYHRLTGFGQHFVVFAQATVLTQPAKCAFYDPATEQNLESLRVGIALNNLEYPTAGVFDPIDQLACIATICLDQAQA